MLKVLDFGLAFAGEDAVAVLNRVLAGPPEPLAQVHAGVPRAACLLVERAMERTVEARPESMAALADEVRTLLPSPREDSAGSGVTSARRPLRPRSDPPERRTTSRARGPVAVAAILLATALAAGLQVTWESPAPPRAAIELRASEGWVRRCLPRPPAREGAAMVHDPGRGVTWLFGGSGEWGLLGDMWAWDGVGWSRRKLIAAPPLRDRAAMTRDPERRRLLLFGGRQGNTEGSAALGDVWEWKSGAWAQRSPATLPGSRHGHTMTWDSRRSRAVLLGGSGRSDTWEWDGENWSRIVSDGTPPVWLRPAMSFDGTRALAVLFDGSPANAV